MDKVSEVEKLMSRPIQDLIRIADDLMSEYKRREHTVGDRVKCCTCEYRSHWKEITFGHYMPRRHNATRWELKNGGPQCGECNGPKQGESFKMGAWIDNTYGAGTSDKMIILAHKNYKLDRITVAEKILELKILIDEL